LRHIHAADAMLPNLRITLAAVIVTCAAVPACASFATSPAHRRSETP
jgi:hypothetical protein